MNNLSFSGITNKQTNGQTAKRENEQTGKRTKLFTVYLVYRRNAKPSIYYMYERYVEF